MMIMKEENIDYQVMCFNALQVGNLLQKYCQSRRSVISKLYCELRWKRVSNQIADSG